MSGPPPPKRRGRPRRSGADEKILSVARRVLRQTGYKDFSVDAVHERTGIAKTTIYRRWPSKAALAAAAIAPMPEEQTGDLLSLVRELCGVLNLLATPDADATDVLCAVVAPRREAIRAALEAAGGEDAALAADMIVGTLIARRLFSTEPLDGSCGEDVLARVTRSSSGTAPPPGR